MVDQITDKNHAKLHYLYSAVEFPSFAKEAELATDTDVKELPLTAFADKYNRLYPIDSPANTWISHLFFSKYAEDEYNDYQVEEIGQAFKNAANLWKIDLDYNFKDSFLKEASEITEPTITYKHEGDILAEVHICAQEDLQKVASDILDNHRQYTYTIRRDVAQQLLKVATDLNLEYEHDRQAALEKTAGYGVSTTDRTLNILNTRKNLLKTNIEVCNKIDAAIDMVKQADDRGLLKHTVLQKVAGFIDAIDRLTDLHHPSLTRAPEQDIFTMTVQDRADLEKHAVVLPNKKLISTGQLHSNKEAVDRYLREVCNTDSIDKISPHEADNLLNILS